MINLILSDTKRSLEYLKRIINHKFRIDKIILYSKKKGKVHKFLKTKKVEKLLINCKTNDINSSLIEKKSNFYKSKFNIISTYPGEIVKNKFLLSKNLLHCHPGDLPSFKGSTTIYYSILSKKKICVTIFMMSNKVDEGKILYKKYFPYPKNLNHIEKNFDNKIRALTLVEYISSKKVKKYKNSRHKFLPYYIAHPIIRQIVLNKKKIHSI